MKRTWLRIVRAAALPLCLWAAMWAVGWWVHCACEGAPRGRLGFVDIASFDSEGYLRFFHHIHNLGSLMFRHPLFGPLMFPAFVFGPRLYDLFGAPAADFSVIGYFALIGAVNTCLLWLVTRSWAAIALWLSFPYTWLVGGMAESFGPSTTCLLTMLLMVRKGVRDWRAWTAVTIVTTGVTVSNGAKCALVSAWSIRDWRRLAKLALVACAAVALAALLVVLKWHFLDRITLERGLETTLFETASWSNAVLADASRWRYAWELLYLEPIVMHGGPIIGNTVSPGYDSAWPHLYGLALLALALAGAWRGRRAPVVRALGMMLAVDFFIHVVCGWGIYQAQIYSAHWSFALPVLTSFALARRTEVRSNPQCSASFRSNGRAGLVLL